MTQAIEYQVGRHQGCSIRFVEARGYYTDCERFGDHVTLGDLKAAIDRTVLTKGLRPESERFPKAKPAVEAVVASPKSLDALASILRAV